MDISEQQLREALGLSRWELKALREKAPSGSVYQESKGQGKKPKHLHPWMWTDSGQEWLNAANTSIEAPLQTVVAEESRIINVEVKRCNFPNRRLFESMVDEKWVLMVICKDATKLRPKQKVRVKFKNGVAHLISDGKGRAA
jgi:hypothetical protein